MKKPQDEQTIDLDNAEETAPNVGASNSSTKSNGNVDIGADDIEVDSDVDSSDSSGAKDEVTKIKEKLKIALSEKQEYLDGWQRARAEFVNAKKRADEELREQKKYAAANVVEDLIPVLQSFDMAMGNTATWNAVDKNWRVGIEYIYSQLLAVLASHGVEEINPIGKNYDAVRDEAVETIPVTEKEQDGKVIQVVQKGYSLAGKVIVAPRVKVGEFKK